MKKFIKIKHDIMSRDVDFNLVTRFRASEIVECVTVNHYGGYYVTTKGGIWFDEAEEVDEPNAH